MPIGATGKQLKDVYLGSLDYLDPEKQLILLGKDLVLPAKKHDIYKVNDFYEPIKLESESFDIVIMNPPFTRSAKPNVKFGFAEEKVKKLMSKKLSEISRDTYVKLNNGEEINLKGIGQAGLGAYFVFVADKLLKFGGRLGLVIPRALLSGVSWEKVRRLLYWNYEIEYIISNSDPGDKSLGIEGWNWSENTNLGEVLIIARKTNIPMNKKKTMHVNLWNKPSNSIESILISQQIQNLKTTLRSSLRNGEYELINLGNKEVGSSYFIPQKDLDLNFLYPCIFSNPELNILMVLLKEGSLQTILFKKIIASDGVDIKQIKTTFEEIENPTSYKIVWGHQSSINTVELEENIGYGKSVKKKFKSDHLYSKAAKLLLASRPHLNTENLIAVCTQEKVLATAFWELTLFDDKLEPLYILWLNSTLGLLLYLQCSVNSRGQIIKYKKASIRQLKVLDPEKIDIKKVENFYESVKGEVFRPYPQEFQLASKGKGIRKRIDDFFIKELKLKIDLKSYYEMLSREPILTLERL